MMTYIMMGSSTTYKYNMDYTKNNIINTDMEKGRGTKRRARVTRGARNQKHGKRKHCNVHKPSRLN
jgi:hypothetical protein